jgi:hypothetical protein
MCAKQKTEIIEEELTKGLWGRQGREQHLRHLMKHWIDASVLASEIRNAVDLGIIGKPIERRARNMVVDPVNRAPIADARVSLQVINSNPSSRPCLDQGVAFIHPDFAAVAACGCQMQGYYEGFFAWNRCCLIGEATLGS